MKYPFKYELDTVSCIYSFCFNIFTFIILIYIVIEIFLFTSYYFVMSRFSVKLKVIITIIIASSYHLWYFRLFHTFIKNNRARNLWLVIWNIQNFDVWFQLYREFSYLNNIKWRILPYIIHSLNFLYIRYDCKLIFL